MGTPLRLYNQIAQTIAANQGNTLEENARLFALVNLAMADAGIVTWDAKYTYNFWPPITAIREADLDDNPLTEADPDWAPLGAPGGGLVSGLHAAISRVYSGSLGPWRCSLRKFAQFARF